MTPEEAIKATLAKFPDVREIPVRNVAHWPNNPMHNALNLEQDRKAYNWKGDLLKAIKHVLKIQGKL